MTNALPAHGEMITFQIAPNHGYAVAGESYRVDRKTSKKTIGLTNVKTGSSTDCAAWAFGKSAWTKIEG